MAVVSMKQLLEAGVHFGHQTRRWNPKMKPFIYTERNGIHIIDLQKTVGALEKAYAFVQDTTRQGGKVLFVGTKKQAQEAIAEEASRANQYYVNQRWLGGLLTNFKTIQVRLKRLDELEQMRETGVLAALTKKEQLRLNDQAAKLTRMLGGIRGMRRLPAALFIIDTRKEHIAIHEAARLDIPVVALVDTNSDPDEITYPVPANDDAIRAVRLLSAKMADAAEEGAQEYTSTIAKEEAEEGFEPSAYEGHIFEPEGYDAALEPDGSEALVATAGDDEATTIGEEEEGAITPVTEVATVIPVEEETAQVETPAPPKKSRARKTAPKVDVEGKGAKSTAEPVDEQKVDAANPEALAAEPVPDEEPLPASGEDAMGGDVPPASHEAELGVHPDAKE